MAVKTTTTTTADAVVDPTVLLATQALAVIGTYCEGSAGIHDRSLDEELELMLPASSVVKQWYDAESAAYSAGNDGKALSIAQFLTNMRTAVSRLPGDKVLSRDLTVPMVTRLVKVVPLHSDDTRAEFAAIVAANVADRHAALANNATANVAKVEVPAPIKRDVDTYMRLLPAIADGHYDGGMLTDVGEKAVADAESKVADRKAENVKNRGKAAAVSTVGESIVAAIAAQTAAVPNESTVVAARRVVMDAITALRKLESSADAATLAAADKALTVKL